MDFCTCAFESTTPDSVTMPFFVVTEMSFEEMPFVAINSAFTFVVIHVSVPGCADGAADVSSAANTALTEPSASAAPNVAARILFIHPPCVDDSAHVLRRQHSCGKNISIIVPARIAEFA